MQRALHNLNYERQIPSEILKLGNKRKFKFMLTTIVQTPVFS